MSFSCSQRAARVLWASNLCCLRWTDPRYSQEVHHPSWGDWPLLPLDVSAAACGLELVPNNQPYLSTTRRVARSVLPASCFTDAWQDTWRTAPRLRSDTHSEN